MIAPSCDACHEELTEFGAILFGPPDSDGRVRKEHVCVACYAIVRVEIFGVRLFERSERCASGCDLLLHSRLGECRVLCQQLRWEYVDARRLDSVASEA